MSPLRPDLVDCWVFRVVHSARDVPSTEVLLLRRSEGRILPGLYCVGWARRGPSGTIGTNRPDGFGVIEKIAEDIAAGALGHGGKQGRPGFDTLAQKRALDVVTFRDWKRIEEAEAIRARDGAPREKFVDVAEMIRAKG